jgi:DNA-binding XRE family transcriptional regulator
MSACNVAVSFNDSEKSISPGSAERRESAGESQLAPSRNTQSQPRQQAASTGRVQRNQALYYFPGTVCSRFGARLRELRHERNLTQDRMAVDFGIDRSFISDVERGRKSISLPLLEVIALGMDLSLSDLLKDL